MHHTLDEWSSASGHLDHINTPPYSILANHSLGHDSWLFVTNYHLVLSYFNTILNCGLNILVISQPCKRACAHQKAVQAKYTSMLGTIYWTPGTSQVPRA